MTPTETAVIVPIAAAEPVVGPHRRRFDRAASWGVPAHVTVVYPFVPPAGIDDTIRRLEALVAGVPTFDVTFTECRWFGEDVLWLAPEPEQPFRDLTDRLVAEFPDHPPYAGAHDDVVPHLTVGESRLGSVAELRAAETSVSRVLPLTARVDHALLLAGTDRPDSWRTVATLPLGGVARH